MKLSVINMEKIEKGYNLDLTKNPDFMEFCENLRNLKSDLSSNFYNKIVLNKDDIVLDEDNRIVISLKGDNQSSFIDWSNYETGKTNSIKNGDHLWFSEGIFNTKEAVLVSVFHNVIFYSFVDDEEPKKVYHCDVNSLISNRMLFPYVITIPKDIKLYDINSYNPKQLYNYV